jgi:Dehydrogenases with different specificities (related to short-chain alcohol dehydrogenases)
MKSLYDLNGKVAIVTGASSGLGRGAALAYAEHGVAVACLARRRHLLDELVKEIEAKGGKAIAITCDVTKEEMVKAAVAETIAKFGKIDILLNNAGVAILGDVTVLPLDEWNRGMATNITGIFLMCKYVIPHMKAAKYGKIVNLASVETLLATKSEEMARHMYNASKGAVRGLTVGMAACYSKYGITINSIAPGLFYSEMTANTLFTLEPFMENYRNQCAIGRAGKQEELDGLVLFLSSDASNYITAQNIFIDGGVHNVY